MKRYEFVFKEWCDQAASEIKYPPDCKKVRQELHDHMMDHFEAMLAKGVPEDVATNKTLEAMGSAKELAPQLAAVHHPFWSSMLRTCKILLIILLCLSIIPIWNYISGLNPFAISLHRDFDVYDSASYGGDTGRTLLHLSHPDDVSFSTDGSTFKLTDAAVFTEPSYEDRSKTSTSLYFLIRQTSLLPMSEHREYRQHTNITEWFVIKDDLGNEYSLHNESGWTTGGVQRGIFTYTHECWIQEFSPDAQWVDICYERDGRNCVLHIDLTGGDGT